MKKILGILIIIIHEAIFPLSILMIIFYKFILIDYLILLYFSIVIIGWIIFGKCILITIENNLLDVNSRRSIATLFLENLFNIDKRYTYYFIMFLPLIVILIITYKLLYVYKISDEIMSSLIR